VQESRFEQLKAELLGARIQNGLKPAVTVNLRRAANEAAALAWVTQYPLLVFPQLFEEKAESAIAQAAKQEKVLERSRPIAQGGGALKTEWAEGAATKKGRSNLIPGRTPSCLNSESARPSRAHGRVAVSAGGTWL
jgi:hypothetical protein